MVDAPHGRILSDWRAVVHISCSAGGEHLELKKKSTQFKMKTSD
jgi:hypothetical protein